MSASVMVSASVHLHPADPVVVAVSDIAVGELVGNGAVRARDPIAKGHKVAISAIAQGQPVRKFGQVIGEATRDIAPGDHVHTHNLAFRPSAVDHAIGSGRSNLPLFSTPATFEGILRADGRVATRNYVGVLTTVNCSATVARMTADLVGRQGLGDFPNVDGVVALTHKYGCSAGTEGEPIELLRRTIAGYARHPNFAAVLVVGLGCEANQLGRLAEAEDLPMGERIHSLVIQEEGGSTATARRGAAIIRELLPDANRIERRPVPASHLTIGLQCGGSDGFSGITANPALGAAADLLVRNGGTAILSETPEIYGAEHLLLRRARSTEVGEKLLRLLRWWEEYAAKHDETLDNNPAPGNKAGGLTTILEKSLGAAAKGGTSDLVEVYGYAQPVTAKGFVFMDSPGYDPVSATGQVASGANLICFTTGRGSCYGCKPVPSLKLATNSDVFRRMEEDMDINCGEIADGTATVDEMGERIFHCILETASGRKSKSELLGYGEDEFAPWHFGATL